MRDATGLADGWPLIHFIAAAGLSVVLRTRFCFSTIPLPYLLHTDGGWVSSAGYRPDFLYAARSIL
jgi:hypothetical protein